MPMGSWAPDFRVSSAWITMSSKGTEGALGNVGKLSSHGARLSGRIAAAEQSVRMVAEKNSKDAETKQFVAAITGRLKDLSGAVTAAEGMASARRRAAHAAIAAELDGIDADLLARLGVH